jgi:hypothetical protein
LAERPGEMMKPYFRKVLCISVVFANVLVAAENPFIGTWKMRPEKSTFVRGQEMKEMTISFATEGDKIRHVASGTYVNGQPLDEGGPEGSLLPWDGKPHVVHEAPTAAVSCTPVKDGTSEATMTLGGKLARRVLAKISANGQTLTENRDNYDQQGRKSKTVLVFERQ